MGDQQHLPTDGQLELPTDGHLVTHRDWRTGYASTLNGIYRMPQPASGRAISDGAVRTSSAIADSIRVRHIGDAVTRVIGRALWDGRL